jgi:hypothetical protein
VGSWRKNAGGPVLFDTAFWAEQLAERKATSATIKIMTAKLRDTSTTAGLQNLAPRAGTTTGSE